MAASPNCELCEFPFEPPAWVPEVRDALFAEPIAIDADGCVPLPRGPGLGLEIDEDKVRRYGEKIYDRRA
jgi:L-alanine-DL-glutamate epimerase-like enolase superfamily enzyme